jgi:hypothetical protein
LFDKYKSKFKFYNLDWLEHWKTLNIRELLFHYEEYDTSPVNRILDIVRKNPGRRFLVIVPPIGHKWRKGNTGNRRVANLASGLRNLGVVCDLVTRDGLTVAAQKRNGRLLSKEPKRVEEGKPNFDIVLSCNKVREGVDWVPCDFVLNAAVESSPCVAIQTLGRPFRRYPEKDSVTIVGLVKKFVVPRKLKVSPRELLSDRTNMLLVLTMIHDMAYPVKLNIPSQGGSERGSEGYDEEKPPSTLEELYGERHVTLLRDLFEAASRLRDGKVSESEIDIIIDTLLDDYDTPAEYREEVSEALKIKYARHVSNKNGKIPSLLVPMDATYLREIGGFDKIVKGRSAYRGNLSPEDMERAYKLVRAGYADLYNTDFVPGTMPSMSKRKKYSKAETAALQRQCDVDRRRYLDNPNSWSRDPVVISWWKDKAFPERWAWLTAPMLSL